MHTDPVHVVAWATDALDKVRRELWNQARRTRDPTDAPSHLDAWITEASTSDINAFAELADSIEHHRDGILASITHGMSNALVESNNCRHRAPTAVLGRRNASMPDRETILRS